MADIIQPLDQNEEVDDVQADIEDTSPQYYAEFKKPPQSLKESEEMVENAIERFKRRKVELTEDELQALELDMQRMIDDWINSRSSLETKLRDLNDLYEAVSEQTDFPWVGANSTVIPLGKIKGREITSVLSRTSLRPVPFAVASYAGPEALYDQSKDFVKDLESFVEDKIKYTTNIHQSLEMADPVIFRDGTAPLQIVWETEYERVCDWKLYNKAEDFTSDYPTPDDAGITRKKWQSIVDELSKGNSYEIRYEYDVATYDAPKAYLVPLIDFFHWPVFVPEMNDLLCYGKRIWYTDYQLRMKANLGVFDKDEIEDLIKGAGDQRRDTLSISRDQIEGLNRNTEEKGTKEFEFFELVYKGPVTNEDREKGIFRKYVIYFHKDNHKIYRVEHYPIRKGKINMFPLRFLKRDGRLLGISLLDDIADLCLDVDIQNRQIINSRTITHVPSFKAKMASKSAFDPSRREYRFRPGATYYLQDIDDVVQFDIRPVDLSGSMDNILFYMQLIDMTVGSTSGFSGQSNPIDPRAPARKQQELLRQASNRLDDYVKSLLPDYSAICEFMVDLYYQYAPERIKYYARTEDGYLIEKEIERTKLYNANAKFHINGTSVFLNADIEYDRQLEINTLLSQSPITAQNPKILRNSMERVILASRVPGREDLIPQEEDIPQQLTNSQDNDIEAKDALNKERMQNRALGDQAKRQHEKEVLAIQAATQLANTSLQNAGQLNGASLPEEPNAA